MIRVITIQCYLLLIAGGDQTEKKRAVPDSLTHVQAAREEIRIYKTAAEILTTVSDKKTADPAIEQLKILRKDALAFWRNTQKLLETTDKIDEKLLKDGESASKLFRSEVTRIKNVQGGAGVRQEIQALFLAFTRGCDSEEKLNWRWFAEKATLAYSVKQHLQDFDVELVKEKEYYTPINIRDNRDQKVIYSLNGHLRSHQSIVFSRWKDTLYVAEFCPIATGCEVVALDLKTGKTLWKSRLFGTGPTPFWHSKYSNHVNIETDGKRVIIYGEENDGKYVEQLEINTGKTLANQRFDSDPEPEK